MANTTNDKSKLIVESGSTKTTWIVLNEGTKKKTMTSLGMNPTLQPQEEIEAIFAMVFKKLKQHKFEQVYYYGAGIVNDESKKTIKTIIKTFVEYKKIEIHSDLMAACRASCHKEKGLVAILGTGSNLCFFNGKKITQRTPSLGYLIGDEGSGNRIGAKILKYYFYDIFDAEIKIKFEESFPDLSKLTVFENIYGNITMANRYLATFAVFAYENKKHFMIKNIIEDEFLEFLNLHLYKYPEAWLYPIHIVGSIGYYFQDIIKEILTINNLNVGKIIQNPEKDLIDYHLNN